MPITISLWILIPLASALYMALAGFSYGTVHRIRGENDEVEFDHFIACLLAVVWPLTLVVGVGLILPMNLGLSLFESFTDTGEVKDIEQKEITPMMEVIGADGNVLYRLEESGTETIARSYLEDFVEKKIDEERTFTQTLLNNTMLSHKMKVNDKIDAQFSRERAGNMVRFNQRFDDIEERFGKHVHQIYGVNDPAQNYSGAHNNHHFAGTPMFGYDPETDQHAGPVFTTMHT